jgi:hypothetical protein
MQCISEGADKRGAKSTDWEIFEFSLQPRSKINVLVEAQIWSMHVCFVDH